MPFCCVQSYATTREIQSDSLDTGAIENLLSSAGNMISSFTESPVIVINSAATISSVRDTVASLLDERDGYNYASDLFNMIIRHPAASELKRAQLGDECSRVLADNNQVRALIDIYGADKLALAHLDYRYNIFSKLTDAPATTALRGIDLRLISGKKPDLSSGLLIAIPITPDVLAQLGDREPRCSFFHLKERKWSSEGVEFVRFGNNVQPGDVIQPQCIICNTTHFTGRRGNLL